MQHFPGVLRNLVAALALTAGIVSLVPATASAATTTDTAHINAGGRLQPGYNVTPSVNNVDFSKGPVTLHYFGSTFSFDDEMDFYRFFTRIPSSTKLGTHRIWATQGGGQIAEAYAYVHALSPNITPSSWWLTAGEKLRFDGTGYRPGEPVRLYVNGVNTGISVNAGNSTPYYYDTQGRLPGYFPYANPEAALTYTVPSSLEGKTATFEVRGAWSGASDRVSITVAG